MSFSGFSNNEIAEKMEISHITVSQVIRSPLGRAYLEGLQDRAQEATLDVRKQLVALNTNALKTFERLLDPKEKAPHSVQFNTAKDVLDRNGYKAPDKLSIDMTLSAKSDDEIDAEINAMEKSIARTTGFISERDIISDQESDKSETGNSLKSFESPNRVTDITENSTTIENTSVSDFSASVSDSLAQAMVPTVMPKENLSEEEIIEHDALLDSIPANLFQSSAKN